jgi:hypothetical protein
MRSLNCRCNESKQLQVGGCRKSDEADGRRCREGKVAGLRQVLTQRCDMPVEEWATRSGRTLELRLGKNTTINLGLGGCLRYRRYHQQACGEK